MKSIRFSSLVLLLFLLGVGPVLAAEKLKPFILAERLGEGNMADVVTQVKNKLVAANFNIAGEYSPYRSAHIIVVTNARLKQAAAKSEFGGYGAGQRVAVTQVGTELQVSYTNPVYMANAYRMNDDLADIAEQLAGALGRIQQFGSEEGMTAAKLRKYHYMFGMEYFDEPSELAEYDSYRQAVAAVEAGLAAGKGGAGKVYRIDIPGKQETVFGVSLNNQVECSGDEFIMSEIDFKPLRSSAHLPYEILVSENQVYALYARFRIAINFPDLKMVGRNSFMNIMCAPGAIEDALEAVAAGA